MDSGALQTTSKRYGHRPLFPIYGFNKVERTLALLEEGVIVDETGKLYQAATAVDIIELAFTHNYLLFIQDLSCIPQLIGSFVEMAGTKVICSKSGIPIAIRTQRGNTTRWITTGTSWDIEVDYLTLLQMRRFFDYVGLGVTHTPSSMGNLMMRYVYTVENLSRHTTASLSCESFLREHTVGGIVQTPGFNPQLIYDEALHIDQSSAYVAKWYQQPDGTAIHFDGDCTDMFPVSFSHCTVQIMDDLPLGPFPVKRGTALSKTRYPTRKGVYNDVYLWSDRIEDCIKAGCRVEVHNGWGWRKFTIDNLQWTMYAYKLRQNSHEEFTEKRIKRCSVSGIGSQGMGNYHYFLVSEENATELDRCVPNPDGTGSRLFVRQEADYVTPHMIHWNRYTIDQCNGSVYNFALPFAADNRLLMVDYDAVMVLEKNERELYPARYDIKNIVCPPGTWLWRLLHDVRIVGKRQWESREEYHATRTRRPYQDAGRTLQVS